VVGGGGWGAAMLWPVPGLKFLAPTDLTGATGPPDTLNPKNIGNIFPPILHS